MKTVYRAEFKTVPAEHNEDGSVKSAGTVVAGNGSLHRTRAEAEALKPDNIAQYKISDDDYAAVFLPLPTDSAFDPPKG